ncbi:MAG: hypothetical protein R3E87_15125 [Burkholderiaceae bacterium]
MAEYDDDQPARDERAPTDHFAWLDGGLPKIGRAGLPKIKPPTGSKGRGRRQADRLEAENRWPEFIEWVAGGGKISVYAEKVGVSIKTIQRWRAKTKDREAEYEDALEQSGESLVLQAEVVLRTCAADKDHIARARALSEHYRWMAARRSVAFAEPLKGELGEREIVVRVVREDHETVEQRKAREAREANGSQA